MNYDYGTLTLAQITLLASTKTTDTMLTVLLDTLYPLSAKCNTRTTNIRRQIRERYEWMNTTLPEFKGTLYSLYLAVVDYLTHCKSVRRTRGRLHMSIDEIREESLVRGSGRTLKHLAAEMLLRLAGEQGNHVIIPCANGIEDNTDTLHFEDCTWSHVTGATKPVYVDETGAPILDEELPTFYL
jgi:hypothetical protein